MLTTLTSWMASTGGALSWLSWCAKALPKAAPSKKFSVALIWPPLMREANWLPRRVGSPFGLMGRYPGCIWSTDSARRTSPAVTIGRSW